MPRKKKTKEKNVKILKVRTVYGFHSKIKFPQKINKKYEIEEVIMKLNDEKLDFPMLHLKNVPKGVDSNKLENDYNRKPKEYTIEEQINSIFQRRKFEKPIFNIRYERV